MGESIGSAMGGQPEMMNASTYLEIVGPAAAGKTTLARELENRHHQFQLVYPPEWRRLKSFPFFIKNGLSLAPSYASLIFGHQGRRLNTKEFFYMMFLNGWHPQLKRSASGRRMAILDQGPVYMLSLLILFRKGQMGNPFFGKWWKKTLQKWGRVLEMIIWLDAPDDVLARRINTRGQDHIIKGAPVRQTHLFLERSREALDQTLALLRADRSKPAVLSFDTGRQSLDEITQLLLKEIKLGKKSEQAPNTPLGIEA